MVHPQEDKNATLQQGRGAQRDQPEGQAGRLPYPGETVGRKEPPYQATGLDALSPLLSHVRFPASKEEIIATIGQARIPIDKLRTATVAELLDPVGPNEFPSSAELEQAFSRVFHEQGARETRGGRQWQGDNVTGRPRG